MAEGKSKIWKRLVRLVRGPTFGDYLEDSTEEIRRNPIQMNCPVCGEMAPLAETCPKCGSPHNPPVDRRV